MENIYELLYMNNHGDDFALGSLVSRFDPLIKATIKTLNQKTNNCFSFEDLYQELSITLYDCMSRYREDFGYSFGTYLKRCLINKASSIYREVVSNKTRANYDTVSLDAYVSEDVDTYRYEMIEQRDSLSDPAYIFSFNQTYQSFKVYYDKLDSFDKKVMICYLGKLRYNEAAKKLNISKKAYDNRLQKLKKELKIIFSTY